MPFERALRNYLEEVQSGRAAEAPGHRRVDEGRLHAHFLLRLREREREFPQWVVRTHERWEGQIERFARYLERLPAHQAPTDATGAFEFGTRVLDRAIECLDANTPLVDRLELDRIARGFDLHGSDPETYALENRLTRREPNGELRLTGVGRAFLRLRGNDAVRWLLIVETTQSGGPFDGWRAPRVLLEHVLAGKTIDRYVASGLDGFSFSEASLERLTSMRVLAGFVEAPDEQDVYSYALQAAMRDVVVSVLDTTPWHAAVVALLDDERAPLLPAHGPSRSDATIEQTKMIAHEVRNALVPVRHHIDALLSAVHEAPPRDRVEAARRGVVRVLEFVDQMVATSELITEPSTSFELVDVFREAVMWVEGGDRVALLAPAMRIRLDAPRARFARALANVIRNALQATTPSEPVRVSAESDSSEVRVRIDDGGSGVPPELRTRIFDDGFTTRPGGSGFGLAFLRNVVEGELRGKVWCEDSDLGGARFVIALPAPEPER